MSMRIVELLVPLSRSDAQCQHERVSPLPSSRSSGAEGLRAKQTPGILVIVAVLVPASRLDHFSLPHGHTDRFIASKCATSVTTMTLEVVPEPSKLGTKSHWDEVYAREVDNYRAAGDEGECWFGLDAASDMVEWAQEHVPPEKKPKVLDLGCGNGHLLFSLAQEGDYDTSLMTGVDYAPASIELSRAIATQRGIAGITWKVVDIFEQTSASAESYDLALDKGTFDAISLAPSEAEMTPAQLFPVCIGKLVRPDGIFLLTSCNWTKDELLSRFTGAGKPFEYHSEVKRPTFSFGGQTGSTIVTIAFRRKREP